MRACSNCNSTSFTTVIAPDTFERKGVSFTVEVEHSVCDNCKYEVILTEQIRRNDAILIKEWARIDKELGEKDGN